MSVEGGRGEHGWMEGTKERRGEERKIDSG
jgi:hypothetical protein